MTPDTFCDSILLALLVTPFIMGPVIIFAEYRYWKRTERDFALLERYEQEDRERIRLLKEQVAAQKEIIGLQEERLATQDGKDRQRVETSEELAGILLEEIGNEKRTLDVALQYTLERYQAGDIIGAINLLDAAKFSAVKISERLNSIVVAGVADDLDDSSL